MIPAAVTFSVVNRAGVSPVLLRRAERAIEHQSVSVAHSWGTGTIRFGPGGWPIIISRQREVNLLCERVVAGCHGAPGVDYPYVGVMPTPWAVVSYDHWFPPLSIALSHEALETLVDPGTLGYEICDPAGEDPRGGDYWLMGVFVSRWVGPWYFMQRDGERVNAPPTL